MNSLLYNSTVHSARKEVTGKFPRDYLAEQLLLGRQISQEQIPRSAPKQTIPDPLECRKRKRSQNDHKPATKSGNDNYEKENAAKNDGPQQTPTIKKQKRSHSNHRNSASSNEVARGKVEQAKTGTERIISSAPNIRKPTSNINHVQRIAPNDKSSRLDTKSGATFALPAKQKYLPDSAVKTTVISESSEQFQTELKIDEEIAIIMELSKCILDSKEQNWIMAAADAEIAQIIKDANCTLNAKTEAREDVCTAPESQLETAARKDVCTAQKSPIETAARKDVWTNSKSPPYDYLTSNESYIPQDLFKDFRPGPSSGALPPNPAMSSKANGSTSELHPTLKQDGGLSWKAAAEGFTYNSVKKISMECSSTNRANGSTSKLHQTLKQNGGLPWKAAAEEFTYNGVKEISMECSSTNRPSQILPANSISKLNFDVRPQTPMFRNLEKQYFELLEFVQKPLRTLMKLKASVDRREKAGVFHEIPPLNKEIEELTTIIESPNFQKRKERLTQIQKCLEPLDFV